MHVDHDDQKLYSTNLRSFVAALEAHRDDYLYVHLQMDHFEKLESSRENHFYLLVHFCLKTKIYIVFRDKQSFEINSKLATIIKSIRQNPRKEKMISLMNFDLVFL